VLYESGDTKVFVTQLDGHLYVVKSLVLRAPPKGNIWLSSNLPWISELVRPARRRCGRRATTASGRGQGRAGESSRLVSQPAQV
jgi:hypothetical protein